MKNGKKLAVLIMAAAMIFSLAACGGSSSADPAGKDAATGKTLESIKSAGKIVMATNPDFPPFESLQTDGSIAGIEVEMMEKIAGKLGVELEMVPMDFKSVLPTVQAGVYDIGVSGISVTDERKEYVSFTDPYFMSAQAIVVLADGNIKSKADLEGKSVSVQTGTTAESFTKANGYDVKVYQTNLDAEQAAAKGKVDAWIIDELPAKAMVAEFNDYFTDKQLMILDEPMTTEPYAFAFQQGSDDLMKAVNDALNELVADGTVEALFEKYDAPYLAP